MSCTVTFMHVKCSFPIIWQGLVGVIYCSKFNKAGVNWDCSHLCHKYIYEYCTRLKFLQSYKYIFENYIKRFFKTNRTEKCSSYFKAITTNINQFTKPPYVIDFLTNIQRNVTYQEANSCNFQCNIILQNNLSSNIWNKFINILLLGYTVFLFQFLAISFEHKNEEFVRIPPICDFLHTSYLMKHDNPVTSLLDRTDNPTFSTLLEIKKAISSFVKW